MPETKPVEELLIEMRSKTHIATWPTSTAHAGLVTIEDLLEEIVARSSRIRLAEQMMVDLGEGRYPGRRAHADHDLNAAFGTDVELEADSVGGLFIEIAVASEAGESIEYRACASRARGRRQPDPPGDRRPAGSTTEEGGRG